MITGLRVGGKPPVQALKLGANDLFFETLGTTREADHRNRAHDRAPAAGIREPAPLSAPWWSATASPILSGRASGMVRMLDLVSQGGYGAFHHPHHLGETRHRQGILVGQGHPRQFPRANNMFRGRE